MNRLIFLFWLLAQVSLAQSLTMDEPIVVFKPDESSKQLGQSIRVTDTKPAPPPKKEIFSRPTQLAYVEFRDAKKANVLMMIEGQSGLKISKIRDFQGEVSLKLEDVSWSELLKIVGNQATP